MPALPTPNRLVRRACVAACATLAIGAPAVLIDSAAANAAPVHHSASPSPAAIASSVVTLLNKERAAHHLPKLTVDKHLALAAQRHTATMAAKRSFSHQVKGEAALPARATRAGYKWSTLGENLGHNKKPTAKSALHIVKVWYAEKPPNDGHRQNTLGRAYRNVGVAVILDKKHHVLWMTVDFGRKR